MNINIQCENDNSQDEGVPVIATPQKQTLAVMPEKQHSQEEYKEFMDNYELKISQEHSALTQSLDKLSGMSHLEKGHQNQT